MSNFDFVREQEVILEHFGIEAQREKLFEEFKELAEAFNSGSLHEVQEELADLHNILMQLIDYYGIQKVYDIALYKIQRTKQRIKEGYYEKQNR